MAEPEFQPINQRLSICAKETKTSEGILGVALLETIAKLLKRLGRYRVIFDRDDNEPYLERYYLFLKDRKSFAFNVTLHRILKSDLDDLHDHPWPWVTVILQGGYWEYTRAGKPKWKGAGCVTVRSSRSLHRLELRKNQFGDEIPCWTLFCMGPKQKDWGFLKNGKWVNNITYLQERKRMVAQT